MAVVVSIVFMLLIIIFFGQFVVVIKANISAKKAEQVENKAYEAMVLSPNDANVEQYIEAYIAMHNTAASKFLSRNGTSHAIFNMPRQIQAYIEVEKSPNVSDALKERLKNVFIMKGVPIEI